MSHDKSQFAITASNDGIECRAFRPFGRWALSRNGPQLGVWTCPGTPQRIWPELSSHVESGELAEGERPGAHVAIAKSAHHFIHRIRQDDIAPILRTEEGSVW